MLTRHHNTREVHVSQMSAKVLFIITEYLMEYKRILTLVPRPTACAVILRMYKQQKRILPSDVNRQLMTCTNSTVSEIHLHHHNLKHLVAPLQQGAV